MKKLLNSRAFIAIITALAFGGLGYYMGSSSNSLAAVQKSSMPGDSESNSSTLNSTETTTISVETATNWVSAYGKVAGEMSAFLMHNNPGNQTQNNLVGGAGWTIPMDDLMNALANVDTPRYVRAYIALKDYSSTHFDPHLVMTVVNGYGTSGCNSAGTDEAMGYYFDLVRPCPNMCDINSQLYNAFISGVRNSFPTYTAPCQ